MKAINPSNLWKKKLGDWAVNPYLGCEHGCFHCYVPTMPGSALFSGPVIDEDDIYYERPPERTQRDWGNYIYAKANFVEVLENQLKTFTPEVARSRAITNRVRTVGGDNNNLDVELSDWFDPGWILVSFLTDCYTPMEGKRGLTREVLKLLLEAGHKVRIQTRSAMVERDFDILFEHRDRVLLGTSLPYLDDDIARVLEPHSTSPTRRIQMLGEAMRKGIPTYVAIAPVMPFYDPERNRPLYQEVFNYFSGLTSIQSLEPLREIFCEVLNPKGDNIDMMKDALMKAWEKAPVETADGAPAKKFAAAYLDLKGYDEERWARFTARTLDHGARFFRPSSIAQSPPSIFVPWPDTSRHWAKHLHEREVGFLDQFLPPV